MNKIIKKSPQRKQCKTHTEAEIHEIVSSLSTKICMKIEDPEETLKIIKAHGTKD